MLQKLMLQMMYMVYLMQHTNQVFVVIMEDLEMYQEEENGFFNLNIEAVFASNPNEAIEKLKKSNSHASWDEYQGGCIRAVEISFEPGAQEIYHCILKVRSNKL